MNIQDNCIASIHYTLSDAEGEVIDSSEGQEPLDYLHGAANIVPGLEAALLGKTQGDKLKVTVKPEQGYGERDEHLIQELPLSMFGGVEKVEVGMEFHAETENGMQVVEVIGIDGETVVIDGNHPLAGLDLNFEVEVTGVRSATEEELAHGHVHAADGCGHEH